MSPHVTNPRFWPLFVREAVTVEEPGKRTLLRANFYDWNKPKRPIGVFIGANPSAAGVQGGDHTVIKMARLFYYGDAPHVAQTASLLVLNLCPIRATDSAEMRRELKNPDIFGDAWSDHRPALEALRAALDRSAQVFVGWGDCLGKATDILAEPFIEALRGHRVLHLPLTASGRPGHPAYASLKKLNMDVLWPAWPRCTLCGDEIPEPVAYPTTHTECRVLADRLGLPHDDREGWEAALIAAPEAEIRRALDGYRILPTLERRARLLPFNPEDFPF